MGETVYSERDPDSGLFDSFYWRFTGRGYHPTYRAQTVSGDGLLISHEYNRRTSINNDRKRGKIEISNSRIIIGNFDHQVWEGDLGFEFLDIGDSSQVDLIRLGNGLTKMAFKFDNITQRYDFYKGSRYFDESVGNDQNTIGHFGLHRPDIQECGYWFEGPEMVVDETRLIDSLFKRVDVFHGTLGYRARRSHDGLDPKNLEREVEVLARDILDLGVIESALNAQDPD